MSFDKKQIPFALIISRIIIGFTVLICSLLYVPNYPAIAITLFTIGLLSDIFDGIIARRIGVSTEKLRKQDSTADVIFFVCIIIATYNQCPDFFKINLWKFATVAFLEALTYIVCFIKFKKEVATHAIASKLWALVLFATIIQIIATCSSSILFNICFYLGIVSRLEILAIILILKTYHNDVPGFYQAIQLRNGKEIKRHKLFNG